MWYTSWQWKKNLEGKDELLKNSQRCKIWKLQKDADQVFFHLSNSKVIALNPICINSKTINTSIADINKMYMENTLARVNFVYNNNNKININRKITSRNKEVMEQYGLMKKKVRNHLYVYSRAHVWIRGLYYGKIGSRLQIAFLFILSKFPSPPPPSHPRLFDFT